MNKPSNLDVKGIMENNEKESTPEFISYRGYDAVEAAERSLMLSKTERYLRTELTRLNTRMPRETRRLYNETIKNLKMLLEMEHKTQIYGD